MERLRTCLRLRARRAEGRCSPPGSASPPAFEARDGEEAVGVLTALRRMTASDVASLPTAERRLLVHRVARLAGNRAAGTLMAPGGRWPWAARTLRRDGPPTLTSQLPASTGLSAGEEWSAEEEERNALSYAPSSREPDPDWVAVNCQRWAGEIMALIQERISSSVAAPSPGATSAQPGDPDWLEEVVTSLTGLTYQTVNQLYGGPAAWRTEYQATGNYPIVSVCDQLGELIQWVRGMGDYGGGLTAHMERYLQAGVLSPPPVRPQPGVTLFHVVPSGAAHALDLEPYKRVPRLGSWDEGRRTAARRQERRLLGGEWDAGTVRAARARAAESGDAAELDAVDEALDAVYETERMIQHETTIIRTAERRGGTLIQLFDFVGSVAQEGTEWQGMSRYNNPAEYFWGYLPAGTTRQLAQPRGTGRVTIEYQGDVLGEVDLTQSATQSRSLLPPSYYLQILSNLPYTDLLTVRLRLQVGDQPTMEMVVSGRGRPQMSDLTGPGGRLPDQPRARGRH